MAQFAAGGVGAVGPITQVPEVAGRVSVCRRHGRAVAGVGDGDGVADPGAGETGVGVGGLGDVDDRGSGR